MFPIKAHKLYKNVLLPHKRPQASGYDIFTSMDTVCNPQITTFLLTGLKLITPKNTVFLISAHPSFISNFHLQFLVQTIDATYTDELKISVYNPTNCPIFISKHTPVAQLIALPHRNPDLRPLQPTRPKQKSNTSNAASTLLPPLMESEAQVASTDQLPSKDSGQDQENNQDQYEYELNNEV